MWADAKTSEMFHSTSNMAEILGQYPPVHKHR